MRRLQPSVSDWSFRDDFDYLMMGFCGVVAVGVVSVYDPPGRMKLPTLKTEFSEQVVRIQETHYLVKYQEPTFEDILDQGVSSDPFPQRQYATRLGEEPYATIQSARVLTEGEVTERNEFSRVISGPDRQGGEIIVAVAATLE
jgi:hypothetical protein